jgi:hypothetical protein
MIPFVAQNAVNNFPVDGCYCVAHSTFSLVLHLRISTCLDHFEENTSWWGESWNVQTMNAYLLRESYVGYRWVKCLRWSSGSVAKWRACSIVLCCFW